MRGEPASERTPLLAERSSPFNTAIDENDIQNAEAVGQGALGPEPFPGLKRPRSYSHSHWLAPDGDANCRPEPEDAPTFWENGLLAGITKVKFRFIFGGIVLGYFVCDPCGISPRKLYILGLLC